MSNDSTKPQATPGSSAGDSTPSIRIPRIERPADLSGSAQTSSAQTSSAQTSSGQTSSSQTKPQTDKGRPRSTSRPSRPLSAGDYNRTPKAGAASTAVIPSVKSGTATDVASDKADVIDTKAPAKSDATTRIDAKVDAKTEASAATATKSASAARASSNGSVESKSATFTEEKPAASAAADSTAAATGGTGRAATLRLTYIEPWSVTRMAFVISVAMMIVAVVASTIFWLVLELTGVWDQLSGSVTSVLSDDAAAFDITDYLGFGRMIGLSIILSAINVVVMTALATIAAHLYNLAAQIIGGFQVTFNSDQ